MVNSSVAVGRDAGANNHTCVSSKLWQSGLALFAYDMNIYDMQHLIPT
jgi:hypothetical protein